jgi:acetyl esterase/lipase
MKKFTRKVAYLLADVKHAIAWMKANASRYGVDSARVVLGGGSAGAHLALLAAYTPQRDSLTPAALKDADLSVRGVVSWYGPTDMNVYYWHADRTKCRRSTAGPRLSPMPDPAARQPCCCKASRTHSSRLRQCALAAKLREAGVPVVHVEYPQTEHAFDIILPRLSPAAQAALYETERFLALLATEPVTAAASPSNGALRRDSLELQLGQEDFVRG